MNLQRSDRKGAKPRRRYTTGPMFSASFFGDVLMYAEALGLIGKETFAIDGLSCLPTPPRNGAGLTTS